MGVAKGAAHRASWWDRLLRLTLRQRVAGAGTIVAVVGLVVGVAVAASGSRLPHQPGSHTTSTSTTSSTSTTTVGSAIKTSSKVCPLRGTPAPGGKIPQRPALGVKIGNDPASRPQSGLLDADIVYDEMAEGGITRYLAIFQCYEAPVLGPTRSVRWDDWHVLQSFGHPILAFSGGINQWDAAVASLSWLFDANGSVMPTAAAYYRTTNRVPPWNYYTSTQALWALDSYHQPPPPQFAYSEHTPAASAKASVITIANFDTNDYGLTNLQWRWSAKTGKWLRFYGGVPDVDAGGTQLSATNVIVEIVHTAPGPYAESGTTPDVESFTQGSGVAYVLRDGQVERGTWSCPAYGDITAFRFQDGKTMTLAPGNTWVELVPYTGYPVTVTP